MNILLLCDEYPPGRHGGIGTFVQLIAKAFLRQGHKVVVAGLYLHEYGGDDRFDDEGVAVYRFRFGPGAGFRPFATDLPGRLRATIWKRSGTAQRQVRAALAAYGTALRELIDRHQIDIVEMPEFQGYLPYISAPVNFPLLPVPVVVKLHGSLTYFSREAGERPAAAIYESERQILSQATAIAGVSKYTSARTAVYFKLAEVPPVLYNGVEVPAEGPSQPQEPPLVVFTGTLVAKKGIFQLMRAWNLVHASHPDAILEIYGKGPIAPAEALLEAAHRASVRFLGHRSRAELLAALQRCSAAVFPSYAETFGLGPVEAMAAGAPVIFSTRTTGPELIADGVTGLLCDPGSPESIAGSINTLLTNAELRARLATAGRRDVAQRFDIDQVAAEHLRFYQTLIANEP